MAIDTTLGPKRNANRRTADYRSGRDDQPVNPAEYGIDPNSYRGRQVAQGRITMEMRPDDPPDLMGRLAGAPQPQAPAPTPLRPRFNIPGKPDLQFPTGGMNLNPPSGLSLNPPSWPPKLNPPLMSARHVPFAPPAAPTGPANPDALNRAGAMLGYGGAPAQGFMPALQGRSDVPTMQGPAQLSKDGPIIPQAGMITPSRNSDERGGRDNNPINQADLTGQISGGPQPQAPAPTPLRPQSPAGPVNPDALNRAGAMLGYGGAPASNLSGGGMDDLRGLKEMPKPLSAGSVPQSVQAPAPQPPPFLSDQHLIDHTRRAGKVFADKFNDGGMKKVGGDAISDTGAAISNAARWLWQGPSREKTPYSVDQAPPSTIPPAQPAAQAQPAQKNSAAAVQAANEPPATVQPSSVDSRGNALRPGMREYAPGIFVPEQGPIARDATRVLGMSVNPDGSNLAEVREAQADYEQFAGGRARQAMTPLRPGGEGSLTGGKNLSFGANQPVTLAVGPDVNSRANHYRGMDPNGGVFGRNDRGEHERRNQEDIAASRLLRMNPDERKRMQDQERAAADERAGRRAQETAMYVADKQAEAASGGKGGGAEYAKLLAQQMETMAKQAEQAGDPEKAKWMREQIGAFLERGISQGVDKEGNALPPRDVTPEDLQGFTDMVGRAAFPAGVMEQRKFAGDQIRMFGNLSPENQAAALANPEVAAKLKQSAQVAMNYALSLPPEQHRRMMATPGMGWVKQILGVE